MDKNAINTVNIVPIIHLNEDWKNLVNLSNFTVEVKFEIIVNTSENIKIGIKTEVKICIIPLESKATVGWYIETDIVPPIAVIIVSNIGNITSIWFWMLVSVVAVDLSKLITAVITRVIITP